MAYYSGLHGELFIDGTKAAKVQNWSFTSTQETLQASSLGHTDKISIAGMRSLSGQCRLFYYQDTAGAGGSMTKLIEKCVKGGGKGIEDGTATESSSAKLKLNIKDGSTDGRFIEFHCWLTSVAMSMAIGEVVSVDVSFEASGAPLTVKL